MLVFRLFRIEFEYKFIKFDFYYMRLTENTSKMNSLTLLKKTISYINKRYWYKNKYIEMY